MRIVYVSSLLVSMCLMGCLDSELEAQAPGRELTESDRDAARHGLKDAVRSAHLETIDVGGMTAGLSAGRKVQLALPGAGQAVLVIQSVRELLPGVTTLSGHLADDETSDFTLSIEAGKLVGSIRQGKHAWLVEPHTRSDQHLIRTIDRTLLPKDEPALGQPRQLSEAPRSMDQPLRTSLSTGTGNVRVLFLHANNVTNASAQAANIVTAFNYSLSLSGVAGNNYLTIAGVQEVAANFNGQSKTMILDAMRSRAAPFTDINAAMANTNANIAFLLVQEDPTASGDGDFGRVGGVARKFERDNPFALSTDDYSLGDLTALHEIGHVFGGDHEDTAGSARPVVAADGTWMTVMGGYVQCPFTGRSATCVRLIRWSNPDPTHTYLGHPLGVANERDMKSHLESSMPTVSAWTWTVPPSATFHINGQVNGSLILTANTPFTLRYTSTNAVSCDLTAYRNGSVWYSIPNFNPSHDWGTVTGLEPGSYSWNVVCRDAAGWTASATSRLTITCDPRAGTQGQMWITGGGYGQYVYHGGWCSVGTQLPPMCWEGTYFHYQYLLSSSCASGGSGGSCYDNDAWWWVSCQSLVDCVYSCSGQCVQSSC
ncbi:hypothetical protein [Hyalangium minutum]|nr:hypothetical protein [Hyalangium minutum]